LTIGAERPSSEPTDPLTARIVAFLRDIGFEVRMASVEESFLPGVTIRAGTLLVDDERLLYPGDLLHEAGHLAVMTAKDRGAPDGDAGPDLGMEIAAIAWSWAALTHLGLEPEIVFHDAGYKGCSDWHVANFTEGRYVGLPLLQWMGLALDEEESAARGTEPYPHMQRWLRE